jgi:hypothetical protein
MLIHAMLEPHPRMNLRFTRREAEDIADSVNSCVTLCTVGALIRLSALSP